jgi:hypothetical protein
MFYAGWIQNVAVQGKSDISARRSRLSTSILYGFPVPETMNTLHTSEHIHTPITIPTNVQALLPLRTLPICALKELKHLPKQYTGLVSNDVCSSLSRAYPNIDSRGTASSAVPAPEWTYKAMELLKKADGQDEEIQSVRDPQSHSVLHAPWALAWWIRAGFVLENKQYWSSLDSWLDREGVGSPRRKKAARDVRDAVREMPWGARIETARTKVLASTLFRRLSADGFESWLDDDLVDASFTSLRRRVMNSPELKGKVDIATHSFQRLVVDTRYGARTLQEYARAVEQGLEQLYFAWNVAGNHWVAGVVEFKKRTIAFGKHT